MTNKNNQYRAKITRAYGDENMDWEDKMRVTKFMERKGFTCKTNLFLLVPRDIEKQNTYYLTEQVSSNVKDWRIVARPDVACFRGGKLRLLIEIDGAVHRTHDTRPLYDELGIKYIILNKWYLKAEGIECKDWLRREHTRITGEALT